jgi:lipid-binding SYLF domain-containing protein
MIATVRLYRLLAVLLAVATALVATPRQASAVDPGLARDASAALQSLYASQPAAKALSARAKAILVFPTMVKAGFMFGGQIGEGVLLKNGRPAGYYNSVAASYGFQAGIQSFGYALFFMSDDALRQLDQTRGFEVGVGPSVVIVDEGVARSITTSTLTSDVYAFIFDQRGLMAGVGIQGSKITRIGQ